MSTKRQKQVSNLIQQVLSEVFHKDINHMFDKAFVGINYVSMSPDLKIASVYITIFNGGESELEKINKENKRIRYRLAQRLKNELKYIPELRFFIDDLGEYSDNINKLIDSLDIKPKPDNDKKSE